MQHRRIFFSVVFLWVAFAACAAFPSPHIRAASINDSPLDPGSQKGSGQTDAQSSATAQPPSKTKTPPKELPEGKGKDLAQKQCGTCHATNVWTNQHHTREQWSSIIDNMVSKGMHASDDDLDTINEYLAAHFGPVPPAPATSPSSSEPATPPSSH